MQTRRILRAILMFLIKLLLAVVVVVVIYHLGVYAYHFGHSIYDNKSVAEAPGWDVAIVLPEGCTVRETADILEARGLIRDADVFCIQERLSKYHGGVLAGSYVLNTSMNAQEILAVLTGHAQDVTEKEEDNDS